MSIRYTLDKRIFKSNLFQSLGTLTEKALSPMREEKEQETG